MKAGKAAFWTAIFGMFCRTVDAGEIFPATSFVLDNGLEVVAVENRRAPVVTHMIWYKTGGTGDPAGKSGLAHVVEHLMFKGTKNIPDGEFSKIVARNGGRENAFTAPNYTAYFQNIARDRLETVMFLEADRMKNLTLTERDFLPELEVVKEERLMRYDNRPAMLLHERKNKALWGDHPYSRPVIGSRGELFGLTLEDAKKFYETHYAPDNAVLVVAGDISAEELKPLAEKYYGKIPPRSQAAEKTALPLPQPVNARLEMHHPQVNVHTVVKEFVVPSLKSEEGINPYAYAVLAELLGAPHVGALYERFVVKDALARYVSVDYDGYSPDFSSLTLSAVTTDGKEAREIEKRIETLPENFPIREREVEKAKIRLAAETEYLNDNPEKAANLTGRLRVAGFPLEALKKRREKIMSVTKRDVSAALKSLRHSPSVITILAPEEKNV